MDDLALAQWRRRLADGFRDARLPATIDEIADVRELPEAGALVGRPWTELAHDAIRAVHGGLARLRRPGLRHYLPAVLLAALRAPELAEGVVAHLSRDARARDALWPDEQRVIRTWLRWLRDERRDAGAARALTSYWDDPPITPLDEARVALFRRARVAFAADRTPAIAAQLAAAVTRALEDDDGGCPAPARPAIARALSTAQLVLLVDLTEYARRRRPDLDDDGALRFWLGELDRARAVAR
jgi:hypothetical protein